MRLPIILTGILSRTVLKLQIIVQISDEKRPLCVVGPFEAYGQPYAVHLRLIGKLVVDFLFVLIELFSLAVTVEAL